MDFAGVDWKKKIGPLPVYAWGGIAGIGIGGIAWYATKHKNNASASTNSAPLTGDIATGNAGNIGPASGGGNGSTSDSASIIEALNQMGQSISDEFAAITNAQNQNEAAVLAALGDIGNKQPNPSGGYVPPPGVTVLPSGDTLENPGWNTIQPAATNPANNNAVSTSPTVAPPGMTRGTTSTGLTFDVPNSTVDYFTKNPSALPSAQDVAAAKPNTELAAPYVTPQTTAVSNNSGGYWIDVMPVR